jgi:hypothetical protein
MPNKVSGTAPTIKSGCERCASEKAKEIGLLLDYASMNGVLIIHAYI